MLIWLLSTIFSLSGLMTYLSQKDKFDGSKVRRADWETDERAREELQNRAKAMLLEFEKRRMRLQKKVISYLDSKDLTVFVCSPVYLYHSF